MSKDYSADEYKRELAWAYDLLTVAMRISAAAGGIDTTGRNIRAAQLYTRLVVSMYTFVRVLPGNPITTDAVPFWDWGSVAALARAILEAYNVLYYVGIDSVDETELECRRELLMLHLNSEKYRLYTEWGAPNEVLDEFRKGLPSQRERIQRNSFFRTFPPKRQTVLLEGRAAMHLSHPDIAARSGILGKHFRALYRFLSNQVHSTPFAFLSQSNERGRGDENDAERAYTIIAMQIVRECVGRAVLHISDIFPDQIKARFTEQLQRVQSIVDQP